MQQRSEQKEREGGVYPYTSQNQLIIDDRQVTVDDHREERDGSRAGPLVSG